MTGARTLFSGLESWRSQASPDNIGGVSEHCCASRRTHAVVLLAFVCLVLGWARAAWALPAPVTAPAGAGQLALSVGLFEGGRLRARLCARPPCDASTGTPIPLPEELGPLLDGATLEVVDIGQGRHIVHLIVPDQGQQRAYEAVVAAPLGGVVPAVVFEGYTGLVQGEYGARQGPMIYVSEPTADGSRRLVIGKQYESVSLCGRPSVLAPELLNPKDLKLYPAKVQRLPPSERDQAVHLRAVRLEEGSSMGPPVLRAVGASSGTGAPQRLSDGDLATSWSENRGAEGRGEFVTFNAPPELPIAGFDFAIRPQRDDPPAQGVSPRELWLATSQKLYHVTLPEDAWQHPGARYRVMLGTPINTDCVALVIESSFAKGRDQQVTLSEVTAVSEFNPGDVSGLVGALAGGGQRAEAAKAVLMAGGPAAFQAVAKAYPKLDEGGRRVALEVMDQADCELATPTYVRALLSRYKAHAVHARDRLRRCGRKSADELARTLRIAVPRARPILANELGLVAPDRAVLEIAPLLDDDAKTRRRLLRVALARATVDPGAEAAVRQVLTDQKLPDRARLDVLRALGESASHYGAASVKAFERLAKHTDFRTRFLLLKPAAALSLADARARDYLTKSLNDEPDQHIRLGAALAARELVQLTPELQRAAGDPAVRVRKAAIEALGENRVEAAKGVLMQRLSRDSWPMVRSAAAEALSGLAPGRAVDDALGRALSDPSAIVRAPSAAALGQRRARQFAPKLRELLAKNDEDASVRRAAAEALGRMCDTQALDLLTEQALKRSDPLLDQAGRGLAVTALAALAALGPEDLRQRLAPLLSAEAPPGAREAAERALHLPAKCAGR